MQEKTKNAIESLGPDFEFIVNCLTEIEDSTLVVETFADMQSAPHNIQIMNMATISFPVAFVLEKDEFETMPLDAREEVIDILLCYLSNEQPILDSVSAEDFVKLTKKHYDILWEKGDKGYREWCL